MRGGNAPCGVPISNAAQEHNKDIKISLCRCSVGQQMRATLVHFGKILLTHSYRKSFCFCRPEVSARGAGRGTEKATERIAASRSKPEDEVNVFSTPLTCTHHSRLW